MSGQFQADVDALNQFVKDIQDKGGLIDRIQGHPALGQAFGSLAPAEFTPPADAPDFKPGPLDFGQAIPGFDSGYQLWFDYQAKYAGFGSNFAAYLKALAVLAEAAKSIASKYGDAAGYDQVSAQTVQDAFKNAKAP